MLKVTQEHYRCFLDFLEANYNQLWNLLLEFTFDFMVITIYRISEHWSFLENSPGVYTEAFFCIQKMRRVSLALHLHIPIKWVYSPVYLLMIHCFMV